MKTDEQEITRRRAMLAMQFDAEAEAEGTAIRGHNQIRCQYQKPLMGKRALTLDRNKY